MPKTGVFKSVEDLPVILTGEHIAAALNISRAGAYNLMKSTGFPTLRIGKRVVVPKDAFIKWVEMNTGKPAGV